MTRLVSLWQLSQPLHLRRMAIIRDSTVTNRIAHYVHYTHDNFKAMVDNGKASWEAVETVREVKLPGVASTVAGDAVAELDEDGFPRLDASQFQGRDYIATLFECIQATKPKPFSITRNDPIVVKSKNGITGKLYKSEPKPFQANISIGIQWGVQRQSRHQSPGTESGLLPSIKPTPKRKGTQDHILSRPVKSQGRSRKFAKSGVAESVEGLSAKQSKSLKKSVENGELLEQARDKSLANTASQKLTDGNPDAAIVALNPKKKRGRPKSRPDKAISRTLDTLISTSVEATFLDNTDATKALPRARGQRNTSEVPYFPSVAAHTFPIYTSEEKKSTSIPKIRAYGRPRKERSCLGYFPSISAHTLRTISLVMNQPIKRRGGRPRKVINVQGHSSPRSAAGYFPSIAAHTIPYSRLAIAEKAQSNSRAKPLANKHVKKHIATLEYLPSTAAHSYPVLKPTSPTLEGLATLNLTAPTSDIMTRRPRKRSAYVADLDDAAETMTAKPLKRIRQEIKPAVMTYGEQAEAIQRTSLGIHVGPLVALGRPGRGRPPKSRLAVFKSPRLTGLDWFIRESLPTQVGLNSEREQVLPTPVGKEGHNDEIVSSNLNSWQTANYPPGPGNVSVSGSLAEQLAREPAVLPAIHSSRQSLVPGKKRKRTSSTAVERRRAPMMGFFDYPALGNVIPAISEQAGYQRPPVAGLNVDTAVLPESAVADGRDMFAACSLPREAQNELGHNQSRVIHDSQHHPNGDTSLSKFKEQPTPTLEVAPTMTTYRDSANLQTSSNSPTSTGDLVKEVNVRPTQKRPLLSDMASESCPQTSVEDKATNEPAAFSPEQIPAVQSFDTDMTSSRGLNAAVTIGDVLCAQIPQDSSSKITEKHQTAAGPALHLSQSTLPTTQDAMRSPLNQTSANTVPVQAEIPDNTTPRPYENDLSDVIIDDSVTRQLEMGKKTTITKMTPTGGSMGVLRKNLILEIVEKCGGVFPGGKELWNPFTTAWRSRKLMGQPDPRTIKSAQKLLVDSGKLRQLIFTYQNKHGVAVTKTIITLENISSSDPKIKELQDKMIAYDPQLYIPEQAEVSQIVRKCYGLKSQQVSQPIPNYLPVEESTQVQLHYIPAYVKRAALNKIAMEEQNINKQLEAAEKAGIQMEIMGKGRKGSKRTIMAEERQRRQEEELGVPDFEIEGYRHSAVNLSSEQAGISEFQLSVVPPLTREAEAGSKPIVQRLARLKPPPQVGQARLSQRDHPLKLSEQVERPDFTLGTSNAAATREQDEERYHMLDGMAWCGLRSGRGSSQRPQRHVTFVDPLGMHSNFDSTPSPEFEILDLKAGQPWLLDPMLGSLYSPGNEDKLGDKPGSGHVKTRGPRRARSRSKGDTTTPTPRPSNFQPVATGFRPNWDFVNEGPATYNPDFHIQQVSTLMDPDHVFHPPSGTFSVNYTVMRDARLNLWVRPPKSQTLTLLPDELEKKLLQPMASELPNLDSSDTLLEEMDKVMLWELDTLGVEHPKPTKWRFINHTYPGKQQVAEHDSSYRYLREVNLDESTRYTGINGKVVNMGKSDMAPPGITPTKRRAPTKNVKNRRLTSLKANNMPTTKGHNSTTDADGRVFKKIKLRGPRRPKISLEIEKRVMVAVVVVRTLTGGMKRIIDWTLLAEIFAPDFTEKFIHKRWSYLLQRYRAQVEKLQEDFQELFAQAYEDGLVPPLDYNKIKEYDWKWLINWTIKNILDTQIDKTPHLPRSRSRLDRTFELRKATEQDLNGFYELNQPIPIPKRYFLVHKHPFVVPLASRTSPDPAVSELEIAKSWVKANIVTPEDTYSSTVARQKLGSMGEDHIETALNQLLLCKTLSQENRGRLVPGRNYDISQHFLHSLRKNLSVLDFKRAIAYKAHLDSCFHKEEIVEFSYHANDGTVMAIINLVTHGRIHITPVNPPMKPFGLLDGGYMTRQVDRSRMTFTIALTPTASYIYENPLLPLSRPPPSHPADTDPMRARIPIWYDINGALVPVMWDLALAAVLGILAVRPGVGRDVVKGVLRDRLEGWEVELLLAWLVDVGVGEWVFGDGVEKGKEKGESEGERGVRLREWWWCVVGAFEEG